jgi:hypothetical protein
VTFVNGLAIQGKRRGGAAVIAFAGLISLTGCAMVPNEPTNADRVGPVLVVGGGAQNGGWRAWVYRTRTGDLCLEVRGLAGGGYGCGPGAEGLRGPGIDMSEKETFVTGGTRAAGAATARLNDADGSEATTSLVAVDPVAVGWRVYAFAESPSAHPQSVEILDAAGTVIESATVPH